MRITSLAAVMTDIGRPDRVGEREPLQALRRLRVREAEGAPRADPGGPEVVGERRVVLVLPSLVITTLPS